MSKGVLLRFPFWCLLAISITAAGWPLAPWPVSPASGCGHSHPAAPRNRTGPCHHPSRCPLSQFRLVVKMALKLLLVFVEYTEPNALLLIRAVNAVDQARGRCSPSLPRGPRWGTASLPVAPGVTFAFRFSQARARGPT